MEIGSPEQVEDVRNLEESPIQEGGNSEDEFKQRLLANFHDQVDIFFILKIIIKTHKKWHFRLGSLTLN